MSEHELVKNESGHRYEIHVGGAVVGVIDYERDVDVIDLTHTEVGEEHAGKGYAQELADFALADIRDTGLLVRPTCPFIATHIRRNAEYGTLLAAD